jgi:hypothetical protein
MRIKPPIIPLIIPITAKGELSDIILLFIYRRLQSYVSLIDIKMWVAYYKFWRIQLYSLF